jgi:hypothetical protein
MSFQERNITASLVSFSLIMGYFLIRVYQLVRSESFSAHNVFRLWGIVIVLGIVITILLIILSHIGSAIFEAITTGNEDPKIEDIEDERDKLIDLQGTKATYLAASLGVFLAMLTFVLGQPALGMFTLLIFFGLLAQIIGDMYRLVLYRKGF